jgi:hypothetical protein
MKKEKKIEVKKNEKEVLQESMDHLLIDVFNKSDETLDDSEIIVYVPQTTPIKLVSNLNSLIT